MFGNATLTICGRIARTPKFYPAEDSKPAIAYVRVLVNHPDITAANGEKIKQEPTGFNLVGKGYIAELLSQRAQKGDILFALCKVTTGPHNEKIGNDGKVYVYDNMVYTIIPGNFDLMDGKNSQAASYTQTPQPAGYAQTPQATGYAQTPQPAGYAQAPQPAGYAQAPQPAGYAQAPQEDFGQDDSITGELPF